MKTKKVEKVHVVMKSRYGYVLVSDGKTFTRQEAVKLCYELNLEEPEEKAFFIAHLTVEL